MFEFEYPTHMFDSRWINPAALDDPLQHPVEAVKCYFAAGLLTFYPHDKNSDIRKWITLLVFGVWAIFELGLSAGVLSRTGALVYLRPAAIAIIFQMWGIELQNMRAFGVDVTLGKEDTDTDDDSDS